MLEFIREPLAWYIAGPLLGLMVPLLLIVGNKSLGISSSLRHACAICFPAKISFFQYDWKKERWNLFFILGIAFGGYFATAFFSADQPISVSENVQRFLDGYGISANSGILSQDLFSWDAVFTLRGLIMTVLGGFLVGFGARYAGGCTSGHAIMGLSTLQVPSLIATCCFLLGGLAATHILLPYILSLGG